MTTKYTETARRQGGMAIEVHAGIKGGGGEGRAGKEWGRGEKACIAHERAESISWEKRMLQVGLWNV